VSRSNVIILVTSLALCTATGCRAPLTRTADESKLVASGEYIVVQDLDVPSVHGPAGCGAQALATTLAHLEPQLDAQSLADELPWQDRGANPVDLLLEARHRGFGATVTRGTWDDLVQAVQEGQPPLVMIDSSFEVRMLFHYWPTVPMMHWAVVSGVAHDDSELLVAAEGSRHYLVDQQLFLDRWEKSSNCLIRVERSPP
jgi:ABC-type bacteriocin/lantibiotic exporter with double-glycine peptidase domain